MDSRSFLKDCRSSVTLAALTSRRRSSFSELLTPSRRGSLHVTFAAADMGSSGMGSSSQTHNAVRHLQSSYDDSYFD